MMTTESGFQTLALRPNFSWKMPMVPGPQTSWVMRTSTFTQIFSPGVTFERPACLARIFSVMVMPGMVTSPVRCSAYASFRLGDRPISIAGCARGFHGDRWAAFDHPRQQVKHNRQPQQVVESYDHRQVFAQSAEDHAGDVAAHVYVGLRRIPE